MDEKWAIAQLQEFIDLTLLRQPSSQGGIVYLGDFASPVGNHDEIVQRAHVVEQILDRCIPTWRTTIEDDGKKRWSQHREAAQRAKVQLEKKNELAELLGENAPTLSASGMHPWAWQPAKSLWESGHLLEAVRAASVKVNAATQAKLGRRDLSETKLFQEAFSSNPPTEQAPRLRPAGDDDGITSQSVRRGIMAFAEGCYAAIRNPLSHDEEDDIPEQEALELLSAFSLLARWVDGSTVTKV